MKHKLIATILASVLATTSLFAITTSKNLPVVEASAPKADIVGEYYKDVNLNLQGQNFIDQLTPIINKGFKSHSYDKAKEVLAKSDQDPNNKNNIICFYTGQSLSGGWNREHVWAKSHGFPQSSKHAYSDSHHLRPTLISINSTRGNKDFAEVPNGKTDGFGNRWDSNFFEPRDEVKGDVARIMFYMVTKYNHIDGVNLTLTNNVPTPRDDYGNGKFGHLDTLIKWHYQDPVSPFEMNRNNVVYSYQNNRNPYIDHPEYVDLAFPNEFSGAEVDQQKVDNVVALIDALPTTITLEDKVQIKAAESAYFKLNYKEKQLVTNYKKLTKALNDLAKLEGTGEGGGEVTPPVTPEGNGLKITFESVPNSKFVLNKTLDISNKQYFVNGYYKAGASDFRIGHNDNPQHINEKYGNASVITNQVASIEGLYNVSNLTHVSYESTTTHGTVNKAHLLFKAEGSTTYELVDTISFVPSGTLTMSRAKTGSFVLVFEGNKPRVTLKSITLTTGEATNPDTTNPLSSVNVKESVKFTIENNLLTDAGYRLGGIFDKSLFEGATDFGIIAVDMNGANKTISSLGTTMEELKASLNGMRHQIVSAFNEKHEDGNKYQFAYVISNAIEVKNLAITSCVYMIKDGKLYLSNEKTSTFMQALNTYLNDSNLTTHELELVKTAIEILK